MKLQNWITVAAMGGAMIASAQKMHTLPKFKNVEATKKFFHYQPGKAPIVSGHRGGDVAGYPENSISAFQHALEAAPMMFETDPHLTKDNQIVIMHDAKLDRTTLGHGKVKDYTLAEVQAIGMKDFQGNPVPNVHPPSLEEALKWAKGKTILNLDIKDVPQVQKAELVKKLDAFSWTLFTVHKAEEAKTLYAFDKRVLFAAVIFNLEDMKSYEAAGIPWSNIVIAYVGPRNKPENKELYAELHKRGMMVMVAAAPIYDKLPTEQERADAYRQIIKDGADIIESDRPIEVVAALKGLKK